MQLTLNPADRDVLGKSARTFAESLAGTLGAAAAAAGGLPHTKEAAIALAGSTFATAGCAAWHTARNASTGRRAVKMDRLERMVQERIAADRAARNADERPVDPPPTVAGGVLLPTPQA